jgi:hydrophobe/amphiphile efflux-3 (HAE3) family protein
MNRWQLLIINRPRSVLLLVLLLTAFFASAARQIRLDGSVDSLLPRGDPEKQYYDEVRQLFGSEEIGVIGLVTSDIYTPRVLQKIQHLTEEISKIPEVKSVLSLTNAPDIIRSVVEEQSLLIPEIPTTATEWEALPEKVASMPVYLKTLASPDGSAAAITIAFRDNISDDEFLRRGINDTIQAIIDRETGPDRLYYTGLPYFKTHLAHSLRKDLTRFVPLTLLCIMAVLFVSFRSMRGVALPTLTVVVTLTWTLGIMALAGSRLSLGTVALPPLLLVLCTAYSLHVVSEYYELARPGRSAREVVLETLQKTSAPIAITALTTVLGFLSLTVNRIVSIREMGIYASVGITIAFVLSVTMVPALLALSRVPARPHDTFSPWLSTVLGRITQSDIRHRKPILLVSLLIAALAGWQAFSIQVDSNFQSFFRADDPITQATEAINRHLAGSTAFYVMIDGEEPDIIKKQDTLWRIKNLQLYIDSLPGVEKTISFVDYCELLDQGLRELLAESNGAPFSEEEEKVTFWEDPSRLAEVMQLIFLSADSLMGVVNHPEYSRTSILVRTTLSRASEVAATVEKIRAFARKTFPPELTVRPTGTLILHTRTTDDIVIGQINSLALTAGVIFVIMSAMFLSTRVGLIAMLPNLFPLLIFFGLMGATGAVLSLSTNIIASIALGITIDNEIHLMTRLSAAVRTTADQKLALIRTLSTVGKPAVYASLLLVLGFLLLCFSTLVPIQEFGYLSAATIFIALLADVILAPALLATTPIITLWDLLHVKLGKDPHKTISIFTNLRPYQAKIAALMGELQTFPRGHLIIRHGEGSDAMFVMLSGRVEVRVNTTDRPHRVWELQRGDVFGVTSLIRPQERVSDVVALEDVEVLALDERFRTRIWRYPRIAARIFFNISDMLLDLLQDRLQQTYEGQQGRALPRAEESEQSVTSPASSTRTG